VGLLQNALRTSGGLDLWRLTRHFTVHMSITGAICTAKCSTANLKELVVQGSTHSQELEITGFARADMRALYRPDWVALEGQDARRVMERHGSPEEFRRGLHSRTWDELQLAHYCGYLIWNYMVTPFILAESDFETKEFRRGGVRDQRLRRLEVTFPARVVTHAATQTFYFEREEFFLRRLDYPGPDENGAQIAHLFSGHQRFSGILVPTLCRLLSVGTDGVPVAKPTLLDLEIFDVNFA
jgi:hypothetical protein